MPKIKYPIRTFFTLIVVVFYIYTGVLGLVGLVLQIIPGAIILALILYLMRRDQSQRFSEFFFRAFLNIVSVVGFMILSVWIFIGYNTLRPAVLSDITLSNGSGTIVFMEMSHIATPEFYNQKRAKLQELTQSGYVVIIEGVRPGTEENHQKFDAYMGFQFTESLYSVVASLGGLVSQDNDMLYAGISSGSLLSLDLSIDDIVPLIDARGGKPLVSGEIMPRDIESEIRSVQSTMTRGETHFIRLLFRSFLSSLIRDTETLESGLMDSGHRELFQVILHERNTPIIRYIEEHPHTNIIIVYGALHFNGIYEAIQRFSPTWAIRDIEGHHPYK